MHDSRHSGPVWLETVLAPMVASGLPPETWTTRATEGEAVATDEPTDRPSAMTVLGAVPVDELGVVLPHEHLLIELRPFIDASDPELAERLHQPLSIDNLGWV